LLELNALEINRCIRVYETDKSLNVFEGMRKSLPADCFPSLEIEPTSGTNQWATVRSQRPRYQFNMTLTVLNDNEDFGVEYISTVATRIVEILTDPQNLQLRVLNESRWTPTGGLVNTVVLDSLVEDVTYNATKDGSIRTVEFSYFAMIHEPYSDSKFDLGNINTPSILLPKVIP
jgi:hypothetical protein